MGFSFGAPRVRSVLLLQIRGADQPPAFQKGDDPPESEEPRPSVLSLLVCGSMSTLLLNPGVANMRVTIAL